MIEDIFDPALKSYSNNFGREYTEQMTTLGQMLASVLKFFGCRRIHGSSGTGAFTPSQAVRAGVEPA